MIKVAIVDDEGRERDTLTEYFRKFSSEIRETIQTVGFAGGGELLAAYDFTYDLICLDIDMQGQNGIDTAKKLREMDEKVLIIFITNMAQMAIRGYEVQALDFIVKPVNYYNFVMKIKVAVNLMNRRVSKNIVLNTLNGFHKISSDQLYYVEVNGHYLYYHTTEGTFKQKASLKELEDALTGLSFKRCNNCYLVNLKYVDCVDKDDVRVGDDWLRISRPRKKKFLQDLANYMGGVDF